MGLQLTRALRLESAITIAFAGSGGKTSAIFQIARELLGRSRSKDEREPRHHETVIVTTTTHLGRSQVSQADEHWILADEDELSAQLAIQPGVVLITGPIKDDKTNGLDEKQIDWLHHYCRDQNLFLLIEADGSRQRPIKAPASHEPAIPDISEMVVILTGLMGLDKPLNETTAHRPELFSRLSGIHTEDRITIEGLVRFLTHQEGGLKNIPSNSRRAMILNQADTPFLVGAAETMVEPLLHEFSSVVIATLNPEQRQIPKQESVEHSGLPKIRFVHERMAGIILAAGESKRFGKPKQLLPWRGQPFLRAVAQTALSAHLDPVIVVVGAQAELVGKAVEDLAVKVVINGEWSGGQSSSIRAGIAGLGAMQVPWTENGSIPPRIDFVGGAVFLLADQPQIPTSIIRSLIEVHSRELGPIIAPMVPGERRANPVLFDRDTFPELQLLKGDAGGRSLFSKYPVTDIPWQDKILLADVDRPEDYEQLLSGDKS